MPRPRRRRAARSAAPERADEPLRDERLLASCAARPWSASSMERWIGCPVAWFVERLLRPDALEPDPEPLARGALAHAALKDTLEALRARDRQRAADARQPRAGARAAGRARCAANEAAHPLSVAPERRATVRRRLQADLERYLALAAESESPLEPRELELGFGFAEGDERGEASELPAFDLGGGVRLRGRIDRIDVGDGGEAIVYDYKGKDAARRVASGSSDGKLQVALYMRAAEELLGAARRRRPLPAADRQRPARARRARRRQRRRARLRLHRPARARRAARAARRGRSTPRARSPAQAAGGRAPGAPGHVRVQGRLQYPTICRCER